MIMANKRDLKRSINCICDCLLAECVAASVYCEKPNENNIKSLFASVVVIRNDYVRRISHPEPGLEAKVFYRDLITNFNKQIDEIEDQISNLY